MNRLSRMASALRRIDDASSPSISEIAAAFAFVALVVGLKTQGMFA